jgi:hypothetical protein
LPPRRADIFIQEIKVECPDIRGSPIFIFSEGCDKMAVVFGRETCVANPQLLEIADGNRLVGGFPNPGDAHQRERGDDDDDKQLDDREFGGSRGP